MPILVQDMTVTVIIFRKLIETILPLDLSLLQSTSGGSAMKPSPGSATLEDVLDSLLGLPSTGRMLSPSLQGRRHV